LASIGCKEYVFHSHLEKLREKSSENRTKFERNSWRRRLFPRACATGAARPQIRALLLRRISVHERSGRAARASAAAAVVIVADKKSMRETGTNERTNHRPRRAFDSVVGVVDAALLGRPAQRTALYRNQCAICCLASIPLLARLSVRSLRRSSILLLLATPFFSIRNCQYGLKRVHKGYEQFGRWSFRDQFDPIIRPTIDATIRTRKRSAYRDPNE